MRALISVSDKTGVGELARHLHGCGFEIVSTGGTAAALSAHGVPVRAVGQITGLPEMLDGRVKTLHPAIHAGLLARRDDPAHASAMAAHGFGWIDIVVVNLYPFAERLRAGIGDDTAMIESIDVGGPAMIRAAAKNHRDVLVVVDPKDYAEVIAIVEAGRCGDEATRRRFAARAFRHLAAYDSAIGAYLDPTVLPHHLTLGLTRRVALRYGENPHQQAALYADAPAQTPGSTLVDADRLHGPDLSFNNILDMDAAWAAVLDFEVPAATIVKHGNPCGLAVAEDAASAFAGALACDPQAAFGGAIAVNRPVERELAEQIAQSLFHDLVAPGYSDEALAILRRRRSLRVMRVDLPRRAPSDEVLELRRVDGGYLAQTYDTLPGNVAFRVVTERPPTSGELVDLRFAWRAVKHVRSNAIVLARDRALVGIGAGQMSRVDSAEIAVRKAGERSLGAVMASDGLIPFPDGAEVVLRAGATAIVQPGGSVNDAAVIEVANRHGAAMVMTDHRHFRH